MYERNAKLKSQTKYINILTQHINSHKNILNNFMMLTTFVDIKYCVNLIFKFCEMTKSASINKQNARTLVCKGRLPNI